MVTEDIEVSKVSPALTPESQFQLEREEQINNCLGEISRIQKRISELGDNVTEDMLNTLKTCKRLLVDCYFSLPYFKKYIEWNYEAFEELITPIDIINISKYANISFKDEAVYTYIYSVFNTEYLDKLRDENIDHPERAEDPLSQKEVELYTYFLENVFKPSLLDLISNMREGRYRPLEYIMQEEKEAFDKWYKNTEDESAHDIYKDLLTESHKTRHDFRNFMKEYSRACNFTEKLTYWGSESIIAAAKGQLEKAQAIYPANLLMNSTKVAQNLGEIVALGKGYGYNVAPSKKKTAKKEDFLVTVVFEHSNDKLVELSRPISQTDKNIMDAIETLAQTNAFITPSEVYRMINGGEHIKVPPEIVAEYESRIDYMIDIKATVDYSRHINLNGKKGEYKIKGPLLNLYKATRNLNGKTVSGYLYIAPSPVFMYAQEVNQIVSVPAVLLNTKAVQRGGERASNIKFYLLFRLHTIEGQGKTISLDKILSVIGLPNPTARQLRSIRETIENFLDLWSYGKSRTSKAAPDKEILEKSPIKGYSVNTSGKKITGYTLIPKTIVVK